MNRIFITVLFLGLAISANSQKNRITYNNQDLFLNGANLAWIDFANDIGTENVNFERFGKVFKEIHDFGGNSVRLWLHTNGTKTPEFSNDTVIGPGTGAIDDLKQILDTACKYDLGLILCLWSFDMLKEDLAATFLIQNRKILEEEDALNSYIEYALKPMVDSTKNHPGIIAWEVFNEPEGMIPDAFWGGWSGVGHVARANVQRVINRVAGAIHRIDTSLQVTSGAHNMHSLTDKADGGEQGDGNFYSDSALYFIGGDTLGYLDFYQVHHYNFPLNPFNHNCEYWDLDKPLLIGEFHPGDDDLGDFSNYETLIDSGYAGALGWMWLDSYGNAIKDEVQYLFLNRTSDVDIDNNIGDAPAVEFSGPDDGSGLDSGTDVNFSAEAEDTDGTIEKIEFILYRELIADSVLYTDEEAPYAYTWSPDDGIYKVYAKVTDNDGYSKESDRIIFTVGTPPRYRYEAEEAQLTGDATAKTHAEASNGLYVDYTSSGTITWTIPNCPATGSYEMIIGFGVFYGDKNNFIVINGNTENRIDYKFTGSSAEWQRDTLSIELLEGKNTISIEYSWGWMQFDFIEFPFKRLASATSISVSTESGNNFIDADNGTLQMIVTIEPEEASYYPVKWSVSNNSLASIDENGVLTGTKNGTVTVTATTTDGSDLSEEMDITISNQISGIEDNLYAVKLYPSPVVDVLHCKFESEIERIEIYSIQGIRLYTYLVNSAFGAIDVSNYKEGIYYLHVKFSDNTDRVSLFVKTVK
ncbi:MAG: Ig-like domain-containing protein [Bacteroidales bacterium]|nr:Ig-like domain-containing protein [Bacteroidales bacterium]MBN2819030.1 Ig-like domain-containing protein [Bacteroidales bacterium]